MIKIGAQFNSERGIFQVSQKRVREDAFLPCYDWLCRFGICFTFLLLNPKRNLNSQLVFCFVFILQQSRHGKVNVPRGLVGHHHHHHAAMMRWKNLQWRHYDVDMQYCQYYCLHCKYGVTWNLDFFFRKNLREILKNVSPTCEYLKVNQCGNRRNCEHGSIYGSIYGSIDHFGYS